MEHRFEKNYTVGIEEELMILDAETLDLASAIELLDEPGEAVKPELHQSVLEVATAPHENVPSAGDDLRGLRRTVRERAARLGLEVGASGTHPFALWEEQLISPDERYHKLIEQIGFVARQEVIFGQHVHVGVDDPEAAVEIANGLRAYVPLLLAMSANSPYWMGADTGLASARMPIFRQFPRVGIPPEFEDWEDWQARIAFMRDAGMIEDHTWFWFDVRIAPNFGTVEMRAMDAQTDVDYAIGFAAFVQALVKQLNEDGPPPHIPDEYINENKWRAARYGLEGELIDLPSPERITTRALARRVLDRAAEHAADLGGADALGALDELLERGNGAVRQRRLYEVNRDFRELLQGLVDAT